MPMGKTWIHILIEEKTVVFNFGMETVLGEGKKLWIQDTNVTEDHILTAIPEKMHTWIHIWSLTNIR